MDILKFYTTKKKQYKVAKENIGMVTDIVKEGIDNVKGVVEKCKDKYNQWKKYRFKDIDTEDKQKHFTTKKYMELNDFKFVKIHREEGGCVDLDKNIPYYYTKDLSNGDKICLEPCLNGFCVGLYNKSLIVKKKECTNLHNFDYDEAVFRALELAKKLSNN